MARALSEQGAAAFGVAITEEGAALRQAGIPGTILVFGGCFPGQEETFLEFDLTPTVYDLASVRRFSAAAIARDRPIGYHLKLDTGMGRHGIARTTLPASSRRRSAIGERGLAGVFSTFLPPTRRT